MAFVQVGHGSYSFNQVKNNYETAWGIIDKSVSNKGKYGGESFYPPILSIIIKGKNVFKSKYNVAPNKLTLGLQSLDKLKLEIGLKEVIPHQRIKGMKLHISFDNQDAIEMEYVEEQEEIRNGTFNEPLKKAEYVDISNLY